MIIKKFAPALLVIFSLGCSTAPQENAGKFEIAATTLEVDDWEALRDAKIHYAQALISEEISDTSRMREEYELAISVLEDIQLTSKTTKTFEKEFQATANKVSKDYTLSLRRLRLKYGDASDISLMEKLELFDAMDDSSSLAIKVLQDYANDLGTDIPLEVNANVMRIIRFFQTDASESFELWLKRKGTYLEMFEAILESNDLPKELVYLAMVESGFSPRAYSWAHAAGPWQFIYGTGRMYGLRRDWWVDERRDPEKSTRAAAKYLKDLYAEFGDWYLAMAAYNSGSQRVKRAMKRNNTDNYWELTTLPRETRNYVPSFIAATIIGENAAAFGFDVTPESPLSYDEVKIGGSINLSVLSKAAGVNISELIRLNPELRRKSTPPTSKGYKLLIPYGTAELFNKNFAELPESERTGTIKHKVRRGEALSAIATKYGVSLNQIISLNSIRNRNSIRAGSTLLIPTNGKVLNLTKSKRVESPSENPPNSYAIKYKVRKGDTLGHIAEYFNTTALKLRKWNGLRYGKPIYAGEVIKVYIPNYLKLSQPKFSVADPSLFLMRYSVRNGESLSSLESKFDVKKDEIKLWNSLKKNDISEGEILDIWTMKVVEMDNIGAGLTMKVHTVKRGDTIWNIARKNGVTITDMLSWNPWADDQPIKPGDRLKIFQK
ncbi:LysM peptidoglycan-binding domain-containing protein [Candidatus Marinimicrobia bacterium MT.SAG.3]|nr:LysM peptidoglycan-binding domain-containing protein [Candidatus Marinimicrobia bacterium MT.SAG.3]